MNTEVEKRTVVIGGVKLPIGYRFHPTEQELILHYLLRKAFASPLPSSAIPVFDVFFSHPLTFTGNQEKEQRYFFCKKRREVVSNEHNKIKILSGDGYWKQIGKERQIIAFGKTIGIRRTLSFYQTNNSSSSKKTKWNMKEYCLAGFPSTKMFGEWAVYNVYERKRSKGTKQRKSRIRNDEDLSCIDFTVVSDQETGPPPPSPPTSSDE